MYFLTLACSVNISTAYDLSYTGFCRNGYEKQRHDAVCIIFVHGVFCLSFCLVLTGGIPL